MLKTLENTDFSRVLWYTKYMGNQHFTKDELNNLPKEIIISLLLQQNDNFQALSDSSAQIQKQNELLLKQIEDLKEQLAILTQHRFGSHSEKKLPMPGQLLFSWDDPYIFNEAELVIGEEGYADEPEFETVVVRRSRPKGKRAIDLEGIETEIETHYISEEQLNHDFPDGWHQLEDEVYKELHRIPAKYKVVEHHIGVYAGKGDSSTIVRGASPERLLSHSILTPSLAASIFTGKYINAVPLNRISEYYKYDGINISRQVMAGWIIRLNEYYFQQFHDKLKSEVLKSHILHCDETPFKMTGEKDETDPKKQYMWVYYSPPDENTHPVYMYEYDNGSRTTAVIEKYLKGYSGILVTDGYQSYHSYAKRHSDELKVAGCYVHCRRKYADIVKTADGAHLTPIQAVAAEAVQRISAIYHMDKMKKDSSPEERLKHRQQSVKPLVDAFFAWVKEVSNRNLDNSSKLREALTYSINQEPYLRTFLDDPEVPLDNNKAEQSIKKFCVGKHSWHIIESKAGAKASAMMYSIAETAKANNLNPYEYFKYVLEVIKEYPRGDVPDDVLDQLMPWSDSLPEACHTPKK